MITHPAMPIGGDMDDLLCLPFIFYDLLWEEFYTEQSTSRFIEMRIRDTY